MQEVGGMGDWRKNKEQTKMIINDNNNEGDEKE